MVMNEKEIHVKMAAQKDFPGVRMKKNKLPGVFALVLFIFLYCSSFAGAVVVGLSWHPNTEPDLAGYKLYYGSESHTYNHVLDIGKTNSYSLSLPDSSQSLYVALTAYDVERNESAYSQEVIIPAESNDDDNGDDGNEEDVSGSEADVTLTFDNEDEALMAEDVNNDAYPRITADVNGDDYEDLVIFGHNGVYVALSNGSDGYDDPILWCRSLIKGKGWYSQDAYPRQLADVNGDGLADITAFGCSKVYVFLSTGRDFSYAGVWSTEFTWKNGYWYSQDVYPRQLADVNGDGLADIVGFGEEGISVALSTGVNFETSEIWRKGLTRGAGNWYSQDVYPRQLADVNGDGLADIVGFGSTKVYVFLSTGEDFEYAGIWLKGFTVKAGNWYSQDVYPRQLADVNGDGLVDIVAFGYSKVYVVLSTGEDFEYAGIWTEEFTKKTGNWYSQDAYPRQLSDMNGDGLADIVGSKNLTAYQILVK